MLGDRGEAELMDIAGAKLLDVAGMDGCSDRGLFGEVSVLVRISPIVTAMARSQMT